MAEPGKAFRRCGNCDHAETIPNDLQSRICKAGWPSAITLPAPGGIQIKAIWPMVGINDQCGQWAEKPMPAFELVTPRRVSGDA